MAPRGRMRVLFLSLAVLAALAFALGFIAFANNVASQTPPAEPRAEGIVVLTGTGARIKTGLNLLEGQRGQRLLISGVNPAVGADALADAVDADMTGPLSCCIDLGHDARDTIGNAAETRVWRADHGFASLILVTSDYHMPRALAELAAAMPETRLTAYPVRNPHLHMDRWWSSSEASGILIREYIKYLLTVTRIAVSPPATSTPS